MFDQRKLFCNEKFAVKLGFTLKVPGQANDEGTDSINNQSFCPPRD